MAQIDVGYRDDGITVGSYGRLFVTVFREPGTMPRLGEVRRHIEKHIARWGEQNVSLSLVLPGAAAMVPPEVRDQTASITRDYPSLAAAIVIDGEGFRAAMLRAALGAVYLIARSRYPHKIFGTVEDAVPWLTEVMKKNGVDLDAAGLAAALVAAR